MKRDAQFFLENTWFKDKFGRTRILRGVNLGGSSKYPFTPEGASWNSASLDEKYNVSFTGRPFPEDQADEHFKRLASLGCTFLRWVITWEAVEHSGPGEYDEEYLAYLRRMLKKAEEYGIFVFIDPHQDAWSRWTGGDGAPAWTLEAAGFDIGMIEPTGAAFTMQGALKTNKKYRQMTWTLNYQRYACATMNTLFFAGNTYAPDFLIDGESAQDYLQNHFIDAMRHTARRIKDCDAVIGFGTLNEPHFGYIGMSDLLQNAPLSSPRGTFSTPFEGMKAASGLRAEFTDFIITPAGFIKTGTTVIDTNGKSLFREGHDCPWKKAGVWDIQNGMPVLLKKDYFSAPHGEQSYFSNKFLKPFQKKFIAELEKKHDHYIFFIEGVPQTERAQWNKEEEPETVKIADAFHWYDGKTLLLKKWHNWFTVDSFTRKLVFGKKNVRKNIVKQIDFDASKIRDEGLVPFIGEFGVPFDLNKGASYRSGSYTQQIEAITAYYDALDSLLLSGTLWNYTADNTQKHGDGWNGEDLSVFCADTHKIRGEKGFCRPYTMAAAGTPVSMTFKRNPGPSFTFVWDSEPCGTEEDAAVTELFIPSVWFPSGFKADHFDGVGTVVCDKEKQRVFIKTLTTQRCSIRIVSE